MLGDGTAGGDGLAASRAAARVLRDGSIGPGGARPWFVPLLRCPRCLGSLDGSWAAGFACAACAESLPVVGGRLDALPTRAIVRAVALDVRQRPQPRPPGRPRPLARWQGTPTPRISPRQLDLLLERGDAPLRVLDWGCGTAEYRAPIEALGHRYVGVDAGSPAADVRADVHALPFADASVDHVVTSAVLEHVATPPVAVREVARVLVPGGVFAGSVAFLEPHHDASHFHPSVDGVLHLLRDAGLRVDAVWPQHGWLVFDSLATMHGPVSGVSRRLLRLAGRVERVVRGRWWHPRARAEGRWLRAKTPAELDADLLAIAGQLDFVAVKP